jgi:hypothetical protein
MSLYSCSTISLPGSESSNSYRLLSSSSITTVTSPSNNIQDLIADDERCPGEENLIQNNWRIEKNVNIKKQNFEFLAKFHLLRFLSKINNGIKRVVFSKQP